MREPVAAEEEVSRKGAEYRKDAKGKDEMDCEEAPEALIETDGSSFDKA